MNIYIKFHLTNQYMFIVIKVSGYLFVNFPINLIVK